MTYGARGTGDLDPDRRPSLRKMLGRGQPYRRGRPRIMGPTLDAMLKGAPKGLPNPAQFRNQQAKRFAKAYGRGR